MAEERIAPEVSAALRASGVESRPIKAIEQTDLTGLSLMSLVTEMSTARRVEVVGVLPRVLGEALLATDLADAEPLKGPRRLPTSRPIANACSLTDGRTISGR